MSQVEDRTANVRRWDNDRFVCSLFAPAGQRADLMVLYAINLEVSFIRERTTEPMVGRIRLQWWREAIEDVFDGGQARHPLLLSLGELVRRCELDRSHFRDILAARERDFDDEPPPTLNELIAYAEGTSASLAKLSLKVLGADTEANRAVARDVGIVWALTGLVRSVPFQLRAQRLYLPQSVMEAAGFDRSRVARPGDNDALRRAVTPVVECAETFVRDARARRHAVTPEALPILLWMTLAGGYLKRIRKSNFNPFAARVQHRAPSQLVTLALNHARRRY
ncbi:MAG: squalene/phytoene synthase family protein [Hyphomicrobiales bacterium]|nr:squalene/phytoene synthase family protein [Hyphomicrobiales bacterium]